MASDPTVPGDPTAGPESNIGPGKGPRFPDGRRLLSGIQATQILLLLVVLVPVLLVQASIYYRWFDTRRDMEFQANLEVARAIGATFESHVQDLLRHEFAIGRNLVSSPIQAPEQANRVLAEIAQQNTTVRAFSWVDSRGRIVASNKAELVGQDVAQRASFQAIVTGQEWAVSDLVQSPGASDVSIAILRGIRTEEGVLQGIVVAAVDPDRLGEVLRVERASQGTFGLLDRERRVVYRYPGRPLTWEERRASETGVGAARALLGEEVTGVFVSPIDGQVRINSFVPMRSIGWVARAGRPEQVVMAPVVEGLLRDSALLLLVAVVSLMVALALGRRITLPVRRLREHAVAIGRGELHQPVEVAGPPELEELAGAFNRMAGEIRSREGQLKEAKERAELLYRVVPGAIFTVDRARAVTSWNDKAAELTGYSEAEILGRDCRVFAVSPCGEQCGLFTEGVRKPILGAQCTLRRKDGQLRVISKNADLLRNAAGEVIGGIESFEDITDRKRLEEQLLRAQRLEAAGLLAGQVAHDFNNLLAPFTAYPDLIRMQLPPGHPALSYCDAMLEAAQQMADINGEMMALARRGHVDQQPTDLNRLVAQVVERMRDRPETLVVRLDLAPDLRPVEGSPSQLLRVIANLVSNAREAMQDVGLLVLRTENLYVDHPTGHYNRVELGEYVRLSVSDTGCGVPPEIRDRIFDAFFTTKSTGKKRGSGLGLGIVQAIVGDHRGHVDLESQVGKGTTFSVYLPAGSESPRQKSARGSPGGSEAILVVDDDPVQRKVVGELLRRLGYRVEVVARGEEAAVSLRERAADLLILDMVMPGGIDGAETYRRALEVRPGQRAILMSGFAESERVRAAQALGAGAYLRKPLTLERLATAVREALEGNHGRT